jgi:hypothetical protein
VPRRTDIQLLYKPVHALLRDVQLPLAVHELRSGRSALQCSESRLTHYAPRPSRRARPQLQPPPAPSSAPSPRR